MLLLADWRVVAFWDQVFGGSLDLGIQECGLFEDWGIEKWVYCGTR